MMAKRNKTESLENIWVESKAGDDDARHEFESHVLDTVDLTLIDNVFHSWCSYWSSEYNPAKPLPYPYTFHERYVHLGIPYQSTIFDIGDAGKIWRNIKLCNNGFLYSTVPGKPRTIPRHNCDGWNLLNVCRPYLQHVEQYFDRHCGSDYKVRVFYNSKQERLDIKCLGTVNIMLTFEPGVPYRESDDMFQSKPHW